jgi:hypothetical protein
MRVLSDPRGLDAVYIQLSNEWTASPDGGSVMLLPPHVPTRIDLFFDGQNRLDAIRVEEPGRYLLPEIVSAVEPFPKFAKPS